MKLRMSVLQNRDDQLIERTRNLTKSADRTLKCFIINMLAKNCSIFVDGNMSSI